MNRLPKLLRRAYLGGAIEECVLNINEEGFAYIQAVDMSNTIFVDVASDVPLPVLGRLGLGNLGLLCKFFEATKDVDHTLELLENRIKIKAVGRGKLEYLLTQPDLIPTTVDDPDSMNKLVGACVNQVGLTEEVARDILMYLNMLKLNAVTLSCYSNVVAVKGGMETEHQFRIEVGQTLGDDVANHYEINVYADKLVAVLNVLEWVSGEALPKLMFAPDRPLIVQQDPDNTWALVPVSIG